MSKMLRLRIIAIIATCATFSLVANELPADGDIELIVAAYIWVLGVIGCLALYYIEKGEQ